MCNSKHLTLEDRNQIEQGLNNNKTFKDIAIELNKDPSSISKEVRKHRIIKEGNYFHLDRNTCSKKFNCHRKNVCGLNCKKNCRNCEKCNKYCKDFSSDVCLKILRAPYVCNGCTNKNTCKQTKYFYRALSSYKIYKTVLSEARQGINISEDELTTLDRRISPLIKNGQSISHICKTQDLSYSKSTLYKYLANNCFSARGIDLPRRVRMKKRKVKHEIKDTKARVNRTYEDFQKYIEQNPDVSVVEMDTVEGVKGGKVLLTLLFRNSRLMIAILLPDKTQKSVLEAFNNLEDTLGATTFRKLFQVILTDNGTEFGNPYALEHSCDGELRTNIFFCNPRASYQKGMLEKNHEFIRYVLPKGTSFDSLTQDDVTLMINHINSLARESLNWVTPFDLAKLFIGKNTLKKLNFAKVPADEIQLTKTLLKKK